MDWILEPQLWVAFITLVALELVLGVDNVIFISILAGKLPTTLQQRARVIGLSLAVVSRLILLLFLSSIIRLTQPLFSIFNFDVSGRDIIVIVGGLFLIGKATHEIHDKLEGEEGHASTRVKPTFSSFLVQVLLLDMIFSLDSVITAVGMVDRIEIMTAAIVIAAGVMIFSSGPLSAFVERHPTIKMLALAFLLLIGFTLIVEGLHQHIPKGYIYFAMAFSLFVEFLNLRLRKTGVPVKLHEAYISEENEGAKKS
jgi:predicted tellurium resistance membrane protein TerC